MKLIKNKAYSDPHISKVSKSNRLYENCQFMAVIISDMRLKNTRFVGCTFENVIIEASFIENVSLMECAVKSLRVRGNRQITKGGLFSRNKIGSLKNVDLTNKNEIDELVLCGDLKIDNCQFPTGPNFAHIYEPSVVYKECLKTIEKNWIGEKQNTGITEIKKFYLDKQVENQKEDFITYQNNEYLEDKINTTIYEVFSLIKEVNHKMMISK